MPNFFSSQSSVVVVLCGFVECVASGFVDATRGVRETGGFFVFGKHLRATFLAFVDLGGV